MADLAELMARAGSLSPQGVSGSAPILHERTLYLDADGLAYYCAGNDTTLLGEARVRLADKVAGMTRASQAGNCVLLLTGSGSHKGYRYAVARVKAYQAQRASSRRPKNWRPLRDLLETGQFGTTLNDFDREADDRFGQYGHADPANTVIGTQDKDMRMVPGWHLDWIDNRMRWLPPGTYDKVMNDKQYGTKWFWLQMLHGDTADFIPGLPRVGIVASTRATAKDDGQLGRLSREVGEGGKLMQVGEVTAGKLLAGTESSNEAAEIVHKAYWSYYKERALVEMLEQAVLLWMRSGPDAAWYDVALPGNPMHLFTTGPIWSMAYEEIKERVSTAQQYATLAPQDD